MAYVFFGDEPDTADGVVAEAIKRDVAERLEAAMYADDVVADYLSGVDDDLTLEFWVTIDRDLAPAERPVELSLPDDQPFASAIGGPAVSAIVARIRERLLARDGAHDPLGDTPLIFEIAVRPEEVGPAVGA